MVKIAMSENTCKACCSIDKSLAACSSVFHRSWSPCLALGGAGVLVVAAVSGLLIGVGGNKVRQNLDLEDLEPSGTDKGAA